MRTRQWVAACAAGEAVGIAAGAAATVRAPAVGPAIAVALVVAAGIVEGMTLGTLQWRVLRRRVPVPARSWVGPLAAVAPLGWLAALPAALDSAPAAASDPAWWWNTAGGLAAGAGGGLLLGGVQALVLRRRCVGAGRWWAASVAGWAALFGVVMTAAGAVPAGLPLATVALVAAASGAAGGALLGLMTAPDRLLGPRSVPAPPAANAVVLGVLRSPAHRLLDSHLCELRYAGRRGEVVLPVGYRRVEGCLTVTVGRPETKTWWRHFRAGPAAVRIRLDGRLVDATAAARADGGTVTVTVRPARA